MSIQFLVPGRDLVLVAGPGVSMGPVQMGIQFLVPGRDLVLVAGPGVSMGRYKWVYSF